MSEILTGRCQAPGFVEAGLSGCGGGWLWLFLAVGVGCPGGFVLGWGAHADGGVRADGARTSGPTQRWRPLAASMSSQGPWLRRSSALYSELSASARAKPKGVSLGTHRGDCLAVGQGCPVADGSVLHPTVASDAPGQRDQPRCVSAARRPSPGRLGPGRCTLPAGGLPADEPPRVHVSHESHIAPPGEGTNIGGGTSRLRGNVGNPQLIRPESAEMPFDKVGRALLPRSAARGARGLGASDSAQAQVCHEAFDGMRRSTVQRAT